MRIFKRAAAVLLFAAILTVISLTLNELLIPYTFTRMKIHAIENNTWQDLILGSSHGGTNIDPEVLEGETGRSAFNAAQGEEFPVDSLYLLKDACLFHKPERVIYEFDPTYWLTAQETDSNYVLTFYTMQASAVKAEYFGAKMWKADFRTWSAPWYFFRSRIGEIPDTLRIKAGTDYQTYGTETFESDLQSVKETGFISLKKVRGTDKIEIRPWNDQTIQKDDVGYFIRLAEYCRQEGIELAVVTTPVPDSTYEAGKENFDSASAYMDTLAEWYGFTYISYNGDRAQGLDLSDDAYADYDGHMYGDSAEAFSKVFGEYLAGIASGSGGK